MTKGKENLKPTLKFTMAEVQYDEYQRARNTKIKKIERQKKFEKTKFSKLEALQWNERSKKWNGIEAVYSSLSENDPTKFSGLETISGQPSSSR